MTAPMSSHPACVLSRETRLFWDAVRSSSSPTLKMNLPRVCGIPNGVSLKAKVKMMYGV